ncbi:NdufA6 NADH-ubiquinone oxidoreductase 14.8 kDa subunit [Sistotremastrum niveocremeum HHB9708]|uniref:NdufA6 NADH-ubiquinone oxidoreductase 14.8 kDa subunit n=1 Tax=Sistotremastrum niveocremeum HHB9708 TaxID=1314777 RepID=A0A164Q7T1_9AGAM|nr:NdufA6 NADH-ubiquinone oxidoreductase 14.8 kDa subunit [Sistotremastrum niveocremeum HHB9708]
MTTIPSRFARAATRSPDLITARRRAIQLYREWYRSAPEIITIYGITEITPSELRHKFRQSFESQVRGIEDVKVADVWLHKMRVDYQETMNCWKQTPHVMGILLAEKPRHQQTFLQKFYTGRDEDQVLPAATGM